MATAFMPEPEAAEDFGRLANNYMLVQGLQGSLSRSDLNLRTVPKTLQLIIDEDAWRSFLLPNGEIVRNPADFRRFVESPRPEGCETPIHVLRRMVAGTDVADEVERLLRGTPGGANNLAGINQYAEVNRNNITVDQSEPTILPLLSEPAPRRRDYARESKQGTSVGYLLRRLEKADPTLLYQVKAGELTPNAAAIRAGFRDRMINVPAVPVKAARILLRHFHGDDLRELVAALAAEVE